MNKIKKPIAQKRHLKSVGAYKKTGKNYKLAGIWWCDYCSMHVEPEHVTFEETHDVRFGGCGNKL